MNNANKNGAATTTTTPKVEAKQTPIVTIDTTAKPTAEQKQAPPTVESVREKNIRLTNLFEREEKLLDTKSNLQNFKLASNELTNTVELSDGMGAEFRTHNPQVIGSIIELIKKDIATKLELTQAEIISLA